MRMQHAASWKWPRYYWNLCKHFGMECYRTWRWELLASLVFGWFVAVLGGNWKDFRTALLATGLTLGSFALWHLVRVPFLLHRSVHAAGDTSDPGPLAGAFGILVIAGVFIGGYELGVQAWNSKQVSEIKAVFSSPSVTSSAEVEQLKKENKELKKRSCPACVGQPKGAGTPMSNAPKSEPQFPSPMFISLADPQSRNLLSAISAFLFLDQQLPSALGASSAGCWIKVTAPKENYEVAKTLSEIATVARCRVEYPRPITDLQPEIEEEALNGASKDVITVHAPKDSRYDNFSVGLNHLFHVKRKYDAVNEGKPNQMLWLQVGPGFPWQEQNTFGSQIGH
jgi:hypothetical protein